MKAENPKYKREQTVFPPLVGIKPREIMPQIPEEVQTSQQAEESVNTLLRARRKFAGSEIHIEFENEGRYRIILVVPEREKEIIFFRNYTEVSKLDSQAEKDFLDYYLNLGLIDKTHFDSIVDYLLNSNSISEQPRANNVNIFDLIDEHEEVNNNIVSIDEQTAITEQETDFVDPKIEGNEKTVEKEMPKTRDGIDFVSFDVGIKVPNKREERKKIGNIYRAFLNQADTKDLIKGLRPRIAYGDKHELIITIYNTDDAIDEEKIMTEFTAKFKKFIKENWRSY